MELKQKLENVYKRIRNGEITVEEAKKAIDAAPTDNGMSSQLADIKRKMAYEQGLDINNNAVGDLLQVGGLKEAVNQGGVYTGADGRIYDNTKGQIHLDLRDQGIGQNVDAVLKVQGGSSADLLNQTNRHQVNMAVIDPVSKFIQAIALKNILN